MLHKDRWYWPFPIASMVRSSEAIIFGQKVFRKNRSKAFKAIYNLFVRIDNVRYWIKYRTQRQHMYHLIDTKLKPGYYDYDYRMLHGCMSLLCDYVENRYGSPAELEKHIKQLREEPDTWGSDSLESSALREDEALVIYRWWKEERPEAHKREEEMMMSLYSGKKLEFKEITLEDATEPLYEVVFDNTPPRGAICTREEYWAYEDELRRKDQEMLHRLIDIREGLWD